MAPVRLRPVLPREHGGWGMFLMPFLAAWAITGLDGGRVGLALGAVLCLYLARYPLFLWTKDRARGFPPHLRNWFLVYLSLGLSLAGWLVLGHQLWLLIPLGLVGLALLLGHLFLSWKRQERSFWGEFLGIAGLVLSAPVASYVASGLWQGYAFWLWFLSLAFFTASIFYVKMKVEEHLPRGGASSPRRRHLARFLGWYQVGVVALVLAFSYSGSIPALSILAFLPMAVQSAWGIWRPVKQLRIKRLGWSQVGHSALFFALLVLVYSVP